MKFTFEILPAELVILILYGMVTEAWGGVLVKALRYWSDSPGIDSRWCLWIFQCHVPSDRIMVLGSTQPLVKMSVRNISWG
jgi:hypothetical protein